MSNIMRHFRTFVIKNTEVRTCVLFCALGRNAAAAGGALRKKERVRRTAPAAPLQPGGKPGMMKATKPERRMGRAARPHEKGRSASLPRKPP